MIESIKIQFRQLQNIEWHNRRLNETCRKLYGKFIDVDLKSKIRIPKLDIEKIYKCRVLYGPDVYDIDIQEYKPRVLNKLKLIVDNDIDYRFKYEDRSAFEKLMTQKGEADDILIVKNGCITDTSYSNIVFFDGSKWITPDTYLLNGTQRQRLLQEGKIVEERITPEDLHRFKLVKPINTMLEIEFSPSVKII